MNLPTWQPIYSVEREGIPEITIYGATALISNNFEYYSADKNTPIIARSLLKPWQLAAVIELLPDEDFMTLAMASHSNEKIHQEKIHKFLEFTKISLDEIFCPESFGLTSPIPKQSHKLFHPCIGKHLAYAYANKKISHQEKKYTDSTHPLQKKLQELMTYSNVKWITDSCGMPTVVMSLKDMADMWLSLSTTESKNMKTVISYWKKNPLLMGGSERLDTWIMEQSEGKIIAKEGADGLLACVSFEQKPIAIVIKIASGYSIPHLGTSLFVILDRNLKQLSSIWLDLHEKLKKSHFQTIV